MIRSVSRMVERDQISRRTALKRGAVAVGTVSGVGLSGAASALDGSTVRVEGDGSYSFYIRGNFDDYEVSNFEDNLEHNDGNAIAVSGTVDDGYWGFFDDPKDVVEVDETINTTQIEPAYPGSVDDSVDVYVDDDQAI